MSTRNAPARDAGQEGAAWAGEPPHRGAARERLLEAAATCVSEGGLGSLTIAAVAKRAGVSRPTVYRYFADRDALVEATLLQAARLFGLEIRAHVRVLADPRQQAVEVVLVSIRQVLDNPVLGQLWGAAAFDAAAVQGFTGPAAIALTRQALAPLIARAGWTDAETDEAVEVMLRFIVSLLAAPAPRREEAELRGFLERRLLPALGL